MSKTIDFRRTWWGHNLHAKIAEDGLLRGFCWSTPGPRVGDDILWSTNYGHARGQVIKARWTINVDDMYEFEAEVVERVLSQ